ncbi:unnamed protein product [Adineta steineri]|uniref:Glycosyltransferase 61 catalytic domain-containing protein n=1 Tax=Adineta steineri TaxID=433720 RepID=A0A814PR56_9BILA|nr:unnamed protein product [Adineta steineri]CAF3604164.1 unnamed protein product [Adineta steineri]
MRRKLSPLFAILISLTLLSIWIVYHRILNFQDESFEKLLTLPQLPKPTTLIVNPLQIQDWVRRYNVTHLFDWTWHKNGDFKRCRTPAILSSQPPVRKFKLNSTTVVNDVVAYFQSHPDEGCIVDSVARLPTLVPHPVPRARSLNDTCFSLHIEGWPLCNRSPMELSELIPAISRFVAIAVFKGYVDTGYCHPEVPGTIFTEHATIHFQTWTARCGNDGIYNIPRIKPKYQHTELIDSIGTYLSAPGHFGPQQLPRLLRLLATVPTTAKVLVSKGGVADLLVDVLVERGIVARDRIIPYEAHKGSYHFASIVYRSETWPYVGNRPIPNHLHDRTDMQLVHRVLAGDEEQSTVKKDRIILIKRNKGRARSIIEHSSLAVLITSALKESNMTSNLHLEIFEAQGHMRDHIALFRRARVIVGPHGAGMMNILWASPGTYVVEIGYTTGMVFPQMYAEMSLHLDHKYWICKGYGDYAAPIHVDLNDFVYIINQILQEIKIENQRS